jgi:Family of unknown function (DUF5808)
MMAFTLLCLLAAAILFFLLFNSRNGNKGYRAGLLIAANICILLVGYFENIEKSGNKIAINLVLLLILNILGIRHVFAKPSPDQDKYDKWHKDPSNWKAGIFYYNPDDKRLFPPKRISGMGWTINFANPNSVLAFIGLFLLIIAAINIFRQSDF